MLVYIRIVYSLNVTSNEKLNSFDYNLNKDFKVSL